MPESAALLSATMLNDRVPVARSTMKNVMITPMIRPMSPVRVVRNALSAASEFGFSSHQCPMSMNEQRPTSSQPTSSSQRVVGDDEQQHRRGEEAQRGEEVGVAAVAAHVLGRVDVHEQRDRGDDEHHHHREAVDLDADAELDARVLEPGDRVHDRRDRRGVLARCWWPPASGSTRTPARCRPRPCASPASSTCCTHW